MVLWMLILAGVLRWSATLQPRPGPRALFNWACLGALLYGLYVMVYRRDEAWRIRWVGQAMLDAVLGVINALIP